MSAVTNQVLTPEERQKFEADLQALYANAHSHSAQGVLSFLWASAKGIVSFVQALSYLPIPEPRDAFLLSQAKLAERKQSGHCRNMAYSVYDTDAIAAMLPIKWCGAKRTTALLEAAGAGHEAVAMCLLQLGRDDPQEFKAMLNFRDDNGVVSTATLITLLLCGSTSALLTLRPVVCVS